MHQPAHQLGDVIVNIERIYTPDRARSAIRIIITERPISSVPILCSSDGAEGDKSPIRDENDEEVPHKANAEEKGRKETEQEYVRDGRREEKSKEDK